MDKSEQMITINIAENFTKYPGPRYKWIGSGSGEEFRDKHLVPALKEYKIVTVELDGTRGYGSSFLEEAFGGAVRQIKSILNPDKLIINTEDDGLREEVQGYINEANKALK